MRRYRKPTLVTFAIVGCLLIAFALGKRSSGPSYQGKPLTEWLTERRRWTPGEEVALSDASTRAVQAIGTNALPLLLKMLRSSDSQLKLRLALRFQRYRFFFNLIPMNGPRQEDARLGLHALGPIARPAFPELVEMILSSDQYGGALYVLMEADSDIIAALTNGLASPDYRVRQRTVCALSALRQAPEVSLPALVQALKDPIPSVKDQAVQSLREYGAAAQAVAPLLNDLSRDPDPAISSFATEALRNIATSTTSKQQ